jgi:hypothetical protein
MDDNGTHTAGTMAAGAITASALSSQLEHQDRRVQVPILRAADPTPEQLSVSTMSCCSSNGA